MIIYLIIMLIVAVIANYCRPHEPLFENIVLGVAWPLTISYYTLVLLVTLGTDVLEILIPKLRSIVTKVSFIIIKWAVTTTNVLRRKVKYAIWCKDTETGKVQKYMDLGSSSREKAMEELKRINGEHEKSTTPPSLLASRIFWVREG